MGAKGSVEAAKLNADNWGHLEVCTLYNKSLLPTTQKITSTRMITGRVPTQLPNLVHQVTFYQPHFRLEISLWLSTSTLSPPALDDFFLFSNHRKKNLFLSLDGFCLFFINFFVYTFEIWVIFDQVGLAVRCF